MALFGMTVKRRGKRTGTFHVDNINTSGKLKANRTMSNTRLVGTALSLGVGGLMMYSAMHYVPSYFGSHNVISMSNLEEATEALMPGEKSSGLLSSLTRHLDIQRTYLRRGQQIQAHYTLEKGTVVELRIRRCQQQFIVEVFDCKVIGEKTMTVANKTTGSHGFTFKDAGFYLFDEKVLKQGEGKSPSYVTWRRS